MRLSKKFIYLTASALVCIAIALFIFFYSAEEEEPAITPTAAVNTTRIKKQKMIKAIPVNGVITFVPGNVHQINFNIEVVVAQILVQPGQKVKKGQRILKLNSSPGAIAALSNAKISVDFAKKEVERLTALRTKYLATNAEVQAAEQSLAKAQAELRSLSATHDTLNRIIISPADGIVYDLALQVGQLVPAGTPLLSIGNNLQAQFNIAIYDKDKLKINQKILVSSLNNKNISESATIASISERIDPSSAMISFSVPLKSAEFIAGEAVSGQLYVGEENEQLAIPKTALLYQGDMPYIFINKNNVAEQKWVTVIYQNESTVYFKSNGIRDGDEAISLGNYELESGIQLRVESQL